MEGGAGSGVKAGKWKLLMLEGPAGAGLERVLCKLQKRLDLILD